MEKNFMAEVFFSKTAYDKAWDAIGRAIASGDEDAKLDLEDFRANADRVYAYVNTVDATEVAIRYAGVKYMDDIHAYQDEVMEMDRRRRDSHEAAIAATNAMNRISVFYGSSNIFMGNVEERLEVADFCLEVSVALFQYRRK